LRFLTHDIVPAPLRAGDLYAASTWSAFAGWFWAIVVKQVAPVDMQHVEKPRMQ
jgi:phosphonate transport system permease protein